MNETTILPWGRVVSEFEEWFKSKYDFDPPEEITGIRCASRGAWSFQQKKNRCPGKEAGGCQCPHQRNATLLHGTS